MPARLRLPAVLLLIAIATAGLALALWRSEQRRRPHRSPGAGARRGSGLEERADAAVLALQGVRAGYDASDRRRVHDLRPRPARPPRDRRGRLGPACPAAERRRLESDEQIRIGAPDGTPFTYPLLHQQPARAHARTCSTSARIPRSVEALRSARTTAAPRLSAPVRLDRDGRLGSLRLRPRLRARRSRSPRPAQRRDALLGVVAGRSPRRARANARSPASRRARRPRHRRRRRARARSRGARP